MTMKGAGSRSQTSTSAIVLREWVVEHVLVPDRPVGCGSTDKNYHLTLGNLYSHN